MIKSACPTAKTTLEVLCLIYTCMSRADRIEDINHDDDNIVCDLLIRVTMRIQTDSGTIANSSFNYFELI